jgi:hypothetical protein
MDELASTEFRKRYATLKEPVVVTVNGHAIGTWLPMSWEVTLPALSGAGFQITSQREVLPTDASQARQAKRDDLLRKINRNG